MEINGTVERAEKHHVEKLGKDKWVVLVGGKSYDCWSSRIEGFLGKELPAGCTVTPAPDGTTFNPKLNLPKDENRSYTGAPRSPGLSDRQAKVMVLSYAKDLATTYAHTHKPDELADVAVKIYAKLWKAVE